MEDKIVSSYILKNVKDKVIHTVTSMALVWKIMSLLGYLLLVVIFVFSLQYASFKFHDLKWLSLLASQSPFNILAKLLRLVPFCCLWDLKSTSASSPTPQMVHM